MSRWQNIPESPGGIPDVAFDSEGNGYIRAGLVSGMSIIKKTVAGDTMTVAGGNGRDNTGDGGAATDATLDGLGGMAVSPSGEIWVYAGSAIRKVSSDGTINTVAGTPGQDNPISAKEIFSGETATDLILDDSGSNMAVDSGGNLFFTPANGTGDNINLLTDGKVYTLAGIGDEGFAGDGGLSTAAEFSNITGMAINADGVLYVADWGNNRIRTLTPDSPLAGSGGGSSGGDGGTGGGDDGTESGDDGTTVELPTGDVGPIGLDLDTADGDQMVRQTTTNPVAGDDVSIDVFITEGASGQIGYNFTLKWDPNEVTFKSYAGAGLFAGSVALLTPSVISAQDSTGEMSSAFLGGSSSGDAGSSGLVTFTINEGFSGVTNIYLTAGKIGSGAVDIGPGAAFVVLGGAAEVELTPAEAANFDGDPTVGFGDFLIFAGGFGKTSADGDFDSRLDLDGDGTVGFLDFLEFAAVFGTVIE